MLKLPRVPRVRHRQALTESGAWVDVGLVGLLREIWRLGMKTNMSCECVPHNAYGGRKIDVVWLSFPDPADALKFFNLCLPLVGPDWSMRAVEWSSKIEMNTDARFPVIQHAAVLEHLRGLPTPAPATDGDLEQETRWIEENICGTCGHNKGVHTGGKCEAPNCLCRTSQPEHVSDMRLVEYASGEPCEAHAEGTRCGQCDLIFIARELIVIRTTPPENTLRPYVRHLNGCAAGRTHACTCGHPDNNHFDFDSQPCAHCSCKAFTVGACSCGLATALVAQKEVV